MTKAVSVRLNDKTRRSVARLARARNRSQSDVIRDAIEAYVEKMSLEVRPYDAWKDVIGIAKGLPNDLSERTGERFTKMLLEDHRRRQRR